VDDSSIHPTASCDQPDSTSSTLLERVRAQHPEAWRRLVELYGPEVYRWCRRSGLGAEDAADVVQEVFTAVAKHVADFRRDQPGQSFRAWLATITRNKVYDYFRRRNHHPEASGGTDAQQRLMQVPDPAEPSVDSAPPVDEGRLPQRALDLVRAEFENRTWEAFCRAILDGQPAREIAGDLGISVNAVYKAKSRVLRRLRQELGDLLT